MLRKNALSLFLYLLSAALAYMKVELAYLIFIFIPASYFLSSGEEAGGILTVAARYSPLAVVSFPDRPVHLPQYSGTFLAAPP
jgi:hypothetical protein